MSSMIPEGETPRHWITRRLQATPEGIKEDTKNPKGLVAEIHAKNDQNDVSGTVTLPKELRAGIEFLRDKAEPYSVLDVNPSAWKHNFSREEQRRLLKWLQTDSSANKTLVDVIDLQVKKRRPLGKKNLVDANIAVSNASLLALGFAAKGHSAAFIQALGAASAETVLELLRSLRALETLRRAARESRHNPARKRCKFAACDSECSELDKGPHR